VQKLEETRSQGDGDAEDDALGEEMYRYI